ncbi:hypothetical protein CYMTET_35718 [Cymbomonas tetramitiformis]|uniref:Uncharacterized protein n=1 Tax=Cymbomonas tetramitiformis TaxID=36881 RepID=A0AAE0KNF7_9CHLO|nr:hypothetical protein CYMTET_35718 [Cymbomonas tetramitiformis]
MTKPTQKPVFGNKRRGSTRGCGTSNLRNIGKSITSNLYKEGVLSSPVSERDLMRAVINDDVRFLIFVTKYHFDFDFDSYYMLEAVRNGSLDVLRWGAGRKLRQHQAIGWEGEEEWLEAAYHMPLFATRAGHIKVLKWLLSPERSHIFDQAYPEYCLCTEAAQHSQWEILRFLVNIGAPGVGCPESRSYVSHALTVATENTHHKNAVYLNSLREEIDNALQACKEV